MKLAAILACVAVFAGFPATAPGQARGNAEFLITKISRNLITTPQFTYTGAQQYQANQRDRWLEVEVEFATAPEFTDELTAKYFILFNGKLLSGEVTHTNVPAGRELRSVMYVAPCTLVRYSQRSLALAASFVCHCMLLGSSAPPRFSGTI